MSADNGIYILATTTKDGNEKEFRVAHCQAIKNIEGGTLGDAYMVLLFGSSEVFTDKTLAMAEALKLEQQVIKNCEILEHGVLMIEKEFVFPDLTMDEANKIIDDYFGSTR